MALYNEVLAGRYNRLLQRLLNMKGGPPAPQLSGDIAAGIELESDRPEWGFLNGEQRFQYNILQGAGGAVTTDAVFRAASNDTLIVIEAIILSSDISNRFDIDMLDNLAAMANVGSNEPRDQRNGMTAPNTSGGGHISSTTGGPALASTVFTIRNGGGAGSVIVPCFWALMKRSTSVNTPGIKIKTAANNCELGVTIWTRERALEEGERIGVT